MKMLHIPYQLLLEKFQYAFFLIGTFPLLKNQMKNHNGITMSNTGLMTHDIYMQVDTLFTFVAHVGCTVEVCMHGEYSGYLLGFTYAYQLTILYYSIDSLSA